MSRKILWLINIYKEYFTLIEESARKQDVELILETYENVTIGYAESRSFIQIGDRPIEEFDLVYFRNVDLGFEKHIAISLYCQQKGITVLDKAAHYQKPWIISKNVAYMKLTQAELPLIDTYHLSKNQFEALKLSFQYPCVVKITDGSLGEGVHLCQNRQEVLDLFDHYQRDLLVQKYLVNKGDLRVFVIGNQAVGAMKRTAITPNEFRNNVSLGAKVELFPLTPELEKLAVAAARAMQYCIAGVDLLYDQELEKWVILEVNKAPQFQGIMSATGIDMPGKIVSFFAQYTE